MTWWRKNWRGYIVSQGATTKHKVFVAWYLWRYSLHHDQHTAWELFKRAVVHDLSKYKWDEAQAFAENVFKLKDTEYGTDAYKALLKSIRPTITLHHDRNTHHPEYWGGTVSRMPDLDKVEMIADWLAAGKRTKDGSFLKSITYNRERWDMPDETVEGLWSIAADMGVKR